MAAFCLLSAAENGKAAGKYRQERCHDRVRGNQRPALLVHAGRAVEEGVLVLKELVFFVHTRERHARFLNCVYISAIRPWTRSTEDLNRSAFPDSFSSDAKLILSYSMSAYEITTIGWNSAQWLAQMTTYHILISVLLNHNRFSLMQFAK